MGLALGVGEYDVGRDRANADHLFAEGELDVVDEGLVGGYDIGAETCRGEFGVGALVNVEDAVGCEVGKLIATWVDLGGYGPTDEGRLRGVDVIGEVLFGGGLGEEVAIDALVFGGAWGASHGVLKLLHGGEVALDIDARLLPAEDKSKLFGADANAVFAGVDAFEVKLECAIAFDHGIVEGLGGATAHVVEIGLEAACTVDLSFEGHVLPDGGIGLRYIFGAVGSWL